MRRALRTMTLVGVLAIGGLVGLGSSTAAAQGYGSYPGGYGGGYPGGYGGGYSGGYQGPAAIYGGYGGGYGGGYSVRGYVGSPYQHHHHRHHRGCGHRYY